MLDIVFLSYDESNAEKNYLKLKDRFPHAKRVHGIKGIANAHLAASKKAFTRFFYVVDGDASIRDDFDFSYKPGSGEEGYVHIWQSWIPALNIAYGYGGIKLFNKSFFKNIKSQLDFSTTLTQDVKFMEQISCDNLFNSDAFRAFRGAFRESAKLHYSYLKKPSKETKARLDAWSNPDTSAMFCQYIRDGYEAGKLEASKHNDLLFINDHDLTVAKLKEKYPYEDLSTDPTPKSDNQMKHEFFFINRIASSMYDEFVDKNLSKEELRDAISDGQLLSKNWIIEKIEDVIELVPFDIKNVAILGGWIGTLALMMFAKEYLFSITNIDTDFRANRIAEKINYGFDFNAEAIDMYDVDYSKYDVIINTSSEHIEDIPKWIKLIPENKLVIVQNNNFLDGNGHISCVNNSDELRRILNLRRVLYEGSRTFAMYDRYMIIGIT